MSRFPEGVCIQEYMVHVPLTNVPISTSVSSELLMPPADTFTPQKKGKVKSSDLPNKGKHSEGLQRKSRAKKGEVMRQEIMLNVLNQKDLFNRWSCPRRG